MMGPRDRGHGSSATAGCGRHHRTRPPRVHHGNKSRGCGPTCPDMFMMLARSNVSLGGLHMKKLSALLATCALVMLGLVAVGSPAQAYPQQGFTVSIVAQTVHSGAVVSAYARSQN